MRIAIGVDFTQEGMRGGDVYARHLCDALAELDSDNEYFLFGYFFRNLREQARKIPCPDRPNFRRLIKRWPQTWVNRIEWEWNLPLIESYLRAARIDLYHSPGPRLPRMRRIPSVVTFHDLIPFARPDIAPGESLPLWQKHAREAAEGASLILASSTETKNALVRFLKISPEKIRVAILGVDRWIFRPLTDQARLLSAKTKYSLPDRFILSVGPYEPRRNWEGILRAVSLFPASMERPGIVFTGSVPPEPAGRLSRLAAELGLTSRVIQAGYVPLDDLVALYNLAEIFAYPSLYDGFNLPIIESMACGTPVLTSHDSALPEIAGGAALLVDPTDDETISQGLLALTAPGARAAYRAKGLARAEELSWEKTARATLDAYRSAAGNP